MELDKKFLAEIITDVVSGIAGVQAAVSNLLHENTKLTVIGLQGVEQSLKRLNEKAEMLFSEGATEGGDKDGQ